jgi:hypothetical protein
MEVMFMHNNCLQAALVYAARGFSVIPVRPDKKPFIKWEPYQKKRATADEIRAWWRQHPDAMIGIVTGEISGILVVDADSEEAYRKLQELLPDSIITPICKTPRGYHLYLIMPKGERIGNSVGILPGVDIRGEGGYCIAPPSINGDGKGYAWQSGLSLGEVEPASVPLDLLKYLSIYIDNSNQRPQMATNGDNGDKYFQQGRRDNDLFHAANCLVKGGGEIPFTKEVLKILAKNSNPPFPENEIQVKIESALKRSERRDRNIAAEVREWVLATNGYFLATTCLQEATMATREEKQAANTAFRRLCEGPEPLLERYGNQRGCYRRIDRAIAFMDFEHADTENTVDLALPLALHRKTKLFPKAAIVVAGVSGMGKTLFCFNSIADNMGRFPIFYFNSEMGPEALKEKLSHFPIPISEWAKSMKVVDGWDFASIPDKIQPDAFNVIDYLEPEGDKPYNIHGVISAIIRRLNKGTALIAIQKKPGATMGTGGIYSIKAATLALSLEWGTIEIVKNRFRESDPFPQLNKINFEIHQGHRFEAKGGWTR